MSKRSFVSQQRFADLPISQHTKDALRNNFGYEFLSKPQGLYMDTALSGADVFVKARTGSGKTLGFLIPMLEVITKYKGPYPVKALILSPSRELATQTYNETKKLLPSETCTQIVTGGNNPNTERKELTHSPCSVLVATPGRLEDHMENLPGFVDALQGISVVVLDEADRLLDKGFEPAIKRILGALSATTPRQTLLFTATVTDNVQKIASAFMRKDYKFIDTVGKEENSHKKIIQEHLVLPVGSIVPALHHVVSAQKAANTTHKIIVFFNTAWMASFMAKLFRAAGMKGVLEIHSRLSQPKRNSIAAQFSKGSGLVLFASDVISRGVDFPDVTLVIQVGLTDASQYEHRVGRTGRAGKTGLGLLIIGEDEGVMLKTLDKIPIKPSTTDSVITGGLTPGKPVSMHPDLSKATGKVKDDPDLKSAANKAYSASIGFYASKMNMLKLAPESLMSGLRSRFASAGLSDPAHIAESTLKKMKMTAAVVNKKVP